MQRTEWLFFLYCYENCNTKYLHVSGEDYKGLRFWEMQKILSLYLLCIYFPCMTFYYLIYIESCEDSKPLSAQVTILFNMAKPPVAESTVISLLDAVSSTYPDVKVIAATSASYEHSSQNISLINING